MYKIITASKADEILILLIHIFVVAAQEFNLILLRKSQNLVALMV